jgi:hypothetical protein
MIGTRIDPAAERVHVFADVSNLVGGARALAPTHGEPPDTVRIHARRLLDVLGRGREIVSAVAVVNARMGAGVAAAYRRAGWTVATVEPGLVTGREQAGDEILQNAIIRALAEDPRATLVLATGDGASSDCGLGFMGTLMLVRSVGCRFAVVSWASTLSRRLRDLALACGTLYLLDPVYRVVTFGEYRRAVEPVLRYPRAVDPSTGAGGSDAQAA